MAKFGVFGELSYGEAIVLDNSFTVAITDNSPILAGVVNNGGVLDISITDLQPVVSSVVDNPSVGNAGEATESQPVVDAIITQQPMRGEAVETLPAISGTTLTGKLFTAALTGSSPTLSGVFTQILPQTFTTELTGSTPSVSATVKIGRKQTAAITDKTPVISGAMSPFIHVGAVAEVKPVVAGYILVPNNFAVTLNIVKTPVVTGTFVHDRTLTAAITDKKPTIAVEFLKGVLTLDTDIIEKYPVVDATVLSPAHAIGACNEAMPFVDSVAIGESVLRGEIVELPPVVHIDINSVTGAVLELKPIVDGEFNSLPTMHGVVSELNPTATGFTLKGVVSTGSVIESKPLVVANDSVMAGHALESTPFITATIKTGGIVRGITRELLPTVDVSTQSESIARGVALENAPMVLSRIVQSATITGVVAELAPIAKATMLKGAIITGNLIDITPILNAIIDNRNALQVALLDNKPTLNGVITQQKVVVINENVSSTTTLISRYRNLKHGMIEPVPLAHGWIEQRKATGTTGKFWL